ncbi:MAG: T9SS type A sorting domain-containing protein, partial [Chitinispirillia bacterium]
KASGGVSRALTPTYNIGIIDETQMDVRRIINGQGITTAVKNQVGRVQHGNMLKAVQLNKQPVCYIEFSVPESDIQNCADIEIVNVSGAVVRTFNTLIQGVVNNISWDQKAGNGRYVSKGLYIVRLKTPSLNVTTKFNIV